MKRNAGRCQLRKTDCSTDESSIAIVSHLAVTGAVANTGFCRNSNWWGAYRQIRRWRYRQRAWSRLCTTRTGTAPGTGRGRRAAHGPFARDDADRFRGTVWQRAVREFDWSRDCGPARPSFSGIENHTKKCDTREHGKRLRGKSCSPRHRSS